MGRVEAEVSVVNVADAKVAGQSFKVDVNKVPGEPRLIVIRGDYEDVMRYLVDYMGVAKGEADEYVTTELKEDVGFDKFMNVICEEEGNRSVRNADVEGDTPARVYQKRYKEYPVNRTTWRVK